MASSRYSYSVDLDDLNTSHSLAILSVRPGSRVLDIGAADGSVARVLAGRGCRVSAVEKDEAAAREVALVCEHVVTGDIERLDLEQALGGQRFDAVLLLDVLEHLREPLAVLERAAAVLVPGGQIIASIPNVAHGAVRLALLRGSFEYTETGLLDRTHLRFFDRPAIEGLFRAAGLHIRDCLRVTRGLTETEIPIDAQAFAPAVVNEVAQDPESATYQFVIVAVPGDESGATSGGESLAGRLQQRLLATERRFREVEGYARSVAGELDVRSKVLDEARTRVAALEAEVEISRGILAAPSVRLVTALDARLRRFPWLHRSLRRLVRFASDGL